MDETLTIEQQAFVDSYNIVLTKLSNIQERILTLKKEAEEAVLELNELRLREKEFFPEQ
jgi:hypothetical protein